MHIRSFLFIHFFRSFAFTAHFLQLTSS